MADDSGQRPGYTRGPPPVPEVPVPQPAAKWRNKPAPEPVPDATAPAPAPPRSSKLLATPLTDQPPAYWVEPIEHPEPSIWEEPSPTPPAYSAPLTPQPTAPTKQPWGVIIGLGVVALGIIGAIIFVIATGPLDRPEIIAEPAPAPSGAFGGGGGQPTTPPADPGIVDATGGVVYTGTSDAMVDLALPGGTDSIAVATIVYTGEGGFFVAGADASGALVRTVSHSSGSYTGTVLLNAEFEDPINRLSIQATGNWTITLRALDSLPTIGQEGVSGTGDMVFWYEGPPGTVAVEHDGESNFVIWSFGTTTDLVVNDIGDYAGEADWPAGRSLIELGADGPWSVSFR